MTEQYSVEKVRKLSRFGHYMYPEYIREVQIAEERVWIFSGENYTLNMHPRRLSVLFVDLSLWSCQVCFVFLVCGLSV